MQYSFSRYACFVAFYLMCGSFTAHADPHLAGRFDTRVNNSYRFGWPGSQIEFKIKGSTFKVRLADSGDNAVMVVIDGSAQRLDLVQGQKEYELIQEKDVAEHHITITKITEGVLGVVTLSHAQTDGVFLPVPPKNRKILVIGDSISNGYGIEGQSTACSFSPETQNAADTYASHIARSFNADLLLLAWSGKGLVQNFDHSKTAMPVLINRIIPSEPLEIQDDRFVPDIIIVHLGTNDYAHGASKAPANFSEAYEELLQDLSDKYPKAFIYPLLGPMLAEDSYQAAKAAIEQSIARLNKKSIRFVTFKGGAYDQFGCDWHPNIRSHAKMAETLQGVIADDLKWEAQ